jgi:hypothetical protein
MHPFAEPERKGTDHRRGRCALIVSPAQPRHTVRGRIVNVDRPQVRAATSATGFRRDDCVVIARNRVGADERTVDLAAFQTRSMGRRPATADAAVAPSLQFLTSRSWTAPDAVFGSAFSDSPPDPLPRTYPA